MTIKKKMHIQIDGMFDPRTSSQSFGKNWFEIQNNIYALIEICSLKIVQLFNKLIGILFDSKFCHFAI